jgi:hypothetical protein
MTIKLELELDQVNQVLDALAKRPFEEVHELIGIIREQGVPQINSQPSNLQTESIDETNSLELV